jgi:hypothetical protein
MEQYKQESYLKTDDNKIINEKYIRWVLKMNECLEVCTKSDGCNYNGQNTHTICKNKSYDSYSKLNEHFK